MCATTSLAARNIQAGRTIHSAFGLFNGQIDRFNQVSVYGQKYFSGSIKLCNN